MAGAMIKPIVKVDTSRFDRAFKQYIRASKRDIKDIVNNKAYFIAAKAAKYTEKTKGAKIRGELRAYSTKLKAPVGAVIIQAQRGRAGKKGLYGKEMKKAVNKMIRARVRAIGFLRVGWFPGLKALARVVKRKFHAKFYGKPKGGARTARGISWKSIATIWNSVSGGKRNAEASRRINKALQKAIDEEERSMRQYVDRKLRKRAEKFNRS